MPPKAIDDDILAEEVSEPEDLPHGGPGFDDPTLVASPDEELLAASAEPDHDPLDLDKEDDPKPDEKDYIRHIFEEFVTLKKKCGEPINNLTYQKFSAKLKKNREALISKHGCAEVKFQVYIKNGRAALKATPVK